MTESESIALAKCLYPIPEDQSYVDVYDYDPIIDHFGRVALRVDDDSYQGDSRILYDDTGKGIGYFTLGWGSCSGCDALQSCRSYEALAELIRDLEASIKWLPAREMLRFFREHDWQGDYGWAEIEQQRFVKEALEYLEGLAA